MRHPFTPAAVALAAFAVAASSAQAQPAARAIVDNAKQQGLVGEQADGLLGFVTGQAAVDLRAAVGEINEGRRTRYAQVAAETGVTPAVAGEATGRQLIARAPAGQFYRTPEGEWRRK